METNLDDSSRKVTVGHNQGRLQSTQQGFESKREKQRQLSLTNTKQNNSQ